MTSFISFFMLINMLLIPGGDPKEPAGAISAYMDSGSPGVVEQIASDEGSIIRRAVSSGRGEKLTYTFPDGDVFASYRTGEGNTLSFTVAGEKCVAAVFDASSGKWTQRELTGRTPFMYGGGIVLLSFDKGSMLIYTPQAYRETDSSCRESLPLNDGVCTAVHGPLGWNVSLSWDADTAPSGTFWDFFILASEDDMINSIDEAPTLGLFGKDNRWCFDGYYYITPKTVTPSGDSIYFMNPASYIASNMARKGEGRVSNRLSVCMLDVMTEHINGEGYIPVTTESEWLASDYGVSAGYFDTRWNTDLALACLTAKDRWGIKKFESTVSNYADCLVRHIESESFLPFGGNGAMAADYSRGTEGYTHSSLNHQLDEILFLYMSGRSAAADRLLEGIRTVGTRWIKPDGNLEYAVKPDGSFTGTDYPYLTYNDLSALQKWLEQSGKGRDGLLDTLMRSKRAWMDKNGVTGYDAA